MGSFDSGSSQAILHQKNSPGPKAFAYRVMRDNMGQTLKPTSLRAINWNREVDGMRVARLKQVD
jgi:hypothetical protein